jgi:hypothetical protein
MLESVPYMGDSYPPRSRLREIVRIGDGHGSTNISKMKDFWVYLYIYTDVHMCNENHHAMDLICSNLRYYGGYHEDNPRHITEQLAQLTPVVCWVADT